jgi:hypothetical protein
MSKKAILTVVLSLASGLAAAGGCWQNGKYVQCPNNSISAPSATITTDQPVNVNGCWRNGKYVMC